MSPSAPSATTPMTPATAPATVRADGPLAIGPGSEGPSLNQTVSAVCRARPLSLRALLRSTRIAAGTSCRRGSSSTARSTRVAGAETPLVAIAEQDSVVP